MKIALLVNSPKNVVRIPREYSDHTLRTTGLGQSPRTQATLIYGQTFETVLVQI